MRNIPDAPWIREALCCGYPVDMDDSPLSVDECFPIEEDEPYD